MISEQLQKRILEAVEKTAALVDDGMHPDDAIAQAVVHHKLGADCVSPLVHAYNTGRTTHQRENGLDPFEKAADFEIANIDNILRKLYPPVQAIKQAAEACSCENSSPQYEMSPTGTIDRRKKRRIALSMPSTPREEKAAATASPQVTTAQVDRLKIKAAQAKQAESESFDKLAQALDAFVDHIRSYESKSLLLIEKHASLLFGAAAAPVIAFVRDNNPLLCKQARHVQSGYPGESTDKKAIDLLKCAIDASAAVLQAAEVRATAEQHLKKANAQLVLPYAQAANRSMLDVSIDDLMQKSALGNMGNMFDAMFGATAAQTVGETLKPTPVPSAVESETLKLMDPAHEAQLRNIRAESTLNELMASDDVISGYGDDEIVDAYNDIVQNAPAVADNRMALQALMRQRLQQGASSPFELEQLGSINRNLTGAYGGTLPARPVGESAASPSKTQSFTRF